jgi:hypothetical protein
MIAEYTKNCDFLRKKFKLPETTSIYELVNTVAQYIRATTSEGEKNVRSRGRKSRH